MTRLAVLLLLLVACRGTTPPPTVRPSPRAALIQRDLVFVYDTIAALRFSPPFAYYAIRAQVEACSGLTREGWPRLYVANLNPLPGYVLAFYSEESRSIVFALGYETNLQTAAHELMHYLLAPVVTPHQRPGESYDDFVTRVHPPEYFGPAGKCAALLYPSS